MNNNEDVIDGLLLDFRVWKARNVFDGLQRICSRTGLYEHQSNAVKEDAHLYPSAILAIHSEPSGPHAAVRRRPRARHTSLRE